MSTFYCVVSHIRGAFDQTYQNPIKMCTTPRVYLQNTFAFRLLTNRCHNVVWCFVDDLGSGCRGKDDIDGGGGAASRGCLL